MARDRRGAEKTGVREVMGDEANSQAFVALFHRYFDPIYRYCYRRLPTVEDAEDATSLIFAKALAELRQRHEGSLRPWLVAIAHNVVADYFRAWRPTLVLAALVTPASVMENVPWRDPLWRVCCLPLGFNPRRWLLGAERRSRRAGRRSPPGSSSAAHGSPRAARRNQHEAATPPRRRSSR
jgi:hypothetical protein